MGSDILISIAKIYWLSFHSVQLWTDFPFAYLASLCARMSHYNYDLTHLVFIISLHIGIYWVSDREKKIKKSAQVEKNSNFKENMYIFSFQKLKTASNTNPSTVGHDDILWVGLHMCHVYLLLLSTKRIHHPWYSLSYIVLLIWVSHQMTIAADLSY